MRTHFHRPVKRPVKLPAIYRHNQAAETQLKLIPHGYLIALTEGRGDENVFLTLVLRVIIGTTLVCYVEDDGRTPLDAIFKKAINSLICVGDRARKLDRWGCSGDELQDIKAALNLADDLQDVSTRRQQAVMYEKVERFVGGYDFTMRNLKALQEKYQ